MRLSDCGRSAHPKLGTSSYRAWFLDELVPGSYRDMITAATTLTEDQGVNYDEPLVIPGPTGRALHFNGSHRVGGAGSTADRNLFHGEWTVGLFFRLRTRTADTHDLFSYQGIADDNDGGNRNALFVVRVNTSNQLQMVWENNNGGTGTNVITTSALSYIDPFQWHYVVWRKREIVAGLGALGEYELDLFVNGVLLETFTGLDNSEDGDTSFWNLGSSVGQTTPSNPSTADIGGAYAWDTPLTDDAIFDDARRFYLADFYTHCDTRFEIDNGFGTMVDLSDLEGLDWIEQVTVTDSNDTPLITGRVSYLREQENLSLAHLRTDSKLNLSDKDDPESFTKPLIADNRACELFATFDTPMWITARPGEHQSLLKGITGKYSWGPQVGVINILDDGKRLQRHHIETVEDYGNELSVTPAATIMQQLLDANDSGTFTGAYPPTTLHTEGVITYAFLKYQQRREKMLSALRTLVGQIAAEVRMRFDKDPDYYDWRLTYFLPPRDKVQTDFPIREEDYLNVTDAAVDPERIRTACRVTYPNSDVRQSTAPPNPALIPGFTLEENNWFNVDDEGNRINASIKYIADQPLIDHGRIFFEVGESSQGQIDRIEEATDFCIRMLKDRSQPDFDYAITIPPMFLPCIDAMLSFSPSRLFTSIQTLAVQQHTLTIASQASLTLKLQGKPGLGPKRWAEIEAGVNGARPATLDPRQANFDLTAGQLRAVARNLLDRTNFGKGGKYLQIPNPDFQEFGNGFEIAPSGWSMFAGIWKTDADLSKVIATTRSGDSSLQLNNTNAQVRSDLFQVDGQESVPYSFEMLWQRASVGAHVPTLRIRWYELVGGVRTEIAASDTPLTPGGAGINFNAVATTAGTWFKSRVDGIHPPAGSAARWMSVELTTSSASIVYVDQVSAYRTSRATKFGFDNVLLPYTGIGETRVMQFSADAGTSTFSEYYDRGLQAIDDHNNGATNDGYHFLTRDAGTYDSVTHTWIVSDPAFLGTYVYEIQLWKDATYTNSELKNPGGTLLATKRYTRVFSTGGFADGNDHWGHPVDIGEDDKISVALQVVSGPASGGLVMALGVGNSPSMWSMRHRGLD